MFFTRLVLVGLATALLAACTRGRSVFPCPYDESLKSTVATEFSSDTGSIAGRVVSIALDPLAGSRVTLLPDRQHVDTRTDGSFRFEQLPPGSYEIAVQRPGYGAARQRVRLLPHGGARVTVTLGASVICLTGHAPSRDGPPIWLSMALPSNER